MEENVFDEELADKIVNNKEHTCASCGTIITGRKKYCESCFRKYHNEQCRLNYCKYGKRTKAEREKSFETFAKNTREYLADVDLTQYGVKKG